MLPPEAMDCAVSEWSEWSVCSAVSHQMDASWAFGSSMATPPSLRSRSRAVLSGSVGCPALHDLAPCVLLDAVTESLGSTSQYGQDAFVLHAFFRDEHGQYKRNGVFVDVGAHDGITLSNSYVAEQALNWTGVCLEPLPEPYLALSQHRRCVPINACAYNTRGNVSFTMVSGPPFDLGGDASMLSGITEAQDPLHHARIFREGGTITDVTVPSVLLRDVLRDAGITHVDLISVDTEGSELQVFQGMDFDEVFVDVVLVELNYHSAWAALRDFLVSKGFVLFGTLHTDVVFRNAASLRR